MERLPFYFSEAYGFLVSTVALLPSFNGSLRLPSFNGSLQLPSFNGRFAP